MRTSIQDTGDTYAIILVKSKARATSLTNGIDDDVSPVIVIYCIIL